MGVLDECISGPRHKSQTREFVVALGSTNQMAMPSLDWRGGGVFGKRSWLNQNENYRRRVLLVLTQSLRFAVENLVWSSSLQGKCPCVLDFPVTIFALAFTWLCLHTAYAFKDTHTVLLIIEIGYMVEPRDRLIFEWVCHSDKFAVHADGQTTICADDHPFCSVSLSWRLTKP